jgi:hypothetical protein
LVVFYLLWVSWAHEVAVVVVWSLRTVRGRELRGSTPGRVSQQRHFADEYSKLELAVSTSFNLGKMKKSSGGVVMEWAGLAAVEGFEKLPPRPRPRHPPKQMRTV